MEPALRDGDTVIVVPSALAEMRPGDIAVFQAEDALIVHRLLRVTADQFLEMGDNRALGAWCPRPERLGRAVALRRGDSEIDLTGTAEREKARAIARASLQRHRAGALAARLPGTLLPRIVRALARRLPKNRKGVMP